MKEPLYIIKIGGNIIDEEPRLISFLQRFASLPARKILVHGGGKLATAMAEKMGLEQTLVNGRRITDAETLKIVTMVYAGYINKNIVARLQAMQCQAFGLCGADGNVLQAHKRKDAELDYGFVGDIDQVHTTLLDQLLQQGLDLVMAPITHDRQGQLLNTNADTIAQQLATGLSEKYQTTLLYCFEKKGVLLNVNEENSVISHLTTSSYAELKKNQAIFAGMLPKLDNAFAALSKGVGQVIIGKAEELEQLFKGESGTTITT